MDKILYSPKEGTTGFWSNKLEIVNPEVIPNVPLWPGDIFDLPSNYEFKEEDIPFGDVKEPIKEFRKVLRLVKTETKENITAKQTDIEWLSELLSNFDSGPLSQDQCVTLIMKRFEVPQPEPEESQTLYTIDEVKEILHNYHCDMFKWPREKVFPEPNWKTEWIDKNLIQRKKQ